MNRIYYVEDDSGIRNLVVYTLNMTGFDARGFESAVEFRQAMKERLPDLVLLDVMLPGESGLDLLRELRTRPASSSIPVMMITARDSEEDKVQGLDVGADDYIAKPFGVMELVARVKAVLRRCSVPQESSILCCGEIRMDTEKHIVENGGKQVQLTLKEYALLRILMEANGHLVDRDSMIEQVWSGNYSGASHTLDAHMRTLRSKLGESGGCIQTIYGRGYRMRTPHEA